MQMDRSIKMRKIRGISCLDLEDGMSFIFSHHNPPDFHECNLPTFSITHLSFFRICPGRYIAFDSVWLAIASLVTVFDISTITDPETGKQAPDLNHEYISALGMYVEFHLSRTFDDALHPPQ
jgi:hypothetical protein